MNRLLCCVALSGAVSFFGARLAWAGGPGTSSAEILKIGSGARAMGMGEAYVAQANDISSLYWNPAGLSMMQESQASFMYNKWLRDLNYNNASVGVPIDDATVGASLSYLSYGQINGYDTSGNAIGDQSAYSGVGTVGGAWLGNFWSAGLNVKGIQDSLADVKGNGVAFDVGAIAVYPEEIKDGTLRMGAVVQNLGPGITFLQQTDPLPQQWKIGIAAVQMMDKKLSLSLDFGKPRDSAVGIQGGAEYWLNPHLALRGGYAATHTESNGFRTGLGLRIKQVFFDYAFAGFGELGMTHRFELSFHFGESRIVLNAEERKILKQAKAAIKKGNYPYAILLSDALMVRQPRYKPALRLFKTSTLAMEQQDQSVEREETVFSPPPTAATAAVVAHKSGVSREDEELERLLDINTPKEGQIIQINPQDSSDLPSSAAKGIR